MSGYDKDPHQNPYWQNINGQNSSGWDNRQNTRNTDPNWHPEDNLGRQLGKTATTFGLLALLSSLIIPVILPLILGSFAIILALISRGRNSSYPPTAKRGLYMGAGALVINVAVLIFGFVSLYQAVNNPEMREELNETLESTYGYSLDDLLDQIGDSYGVTFEEEGTL